MFLADLNQDETADAPSTDTAVETLTELEAPPTPTVLAAAIGPAGYYI